MALTLLVLLLATTGPVFSQEAIGCFVSGECGNSLTVGVPSSQEDAEACLAHCAAEWEDCNYFSFHPDNGFCVLTSNCVEVTTAACPTCICGDASCASNKCFEQGGCTGGYVGIDIVGDRVDCMDWCLTFPDCLYYTFDHSVNSCLLTSSCAVDLGCTTCSHGQRNCNLDSSMSQFLAVGGFDGVAYFSDGEVIDLDRIDSACRFPEDYPISTTSLVATVFHGVPKFCGGDDTRQCFNYLEVTNSWELQEQSMLEMRYMAAETLVKSGLEWLITGGGDHQGGAALITTDWLQESGTFVRGPDLPGPLLGHCIVSINSSHIFLAGGSTSNAFVGTTAAHVMNFIDLLDWHPVTPLNVAKSGHFCALITSQEYGVEILVSGGTDTSTEIYNPRDFTKREGPPMPIPLFRPAVVAFRDSFVVMGGRNGDTFYDDIYKFNVQSWSWDRMARTLSHKRENFAAVLLPDGVVPCGKEV